MQSIVEVAIIGSGPAGYCAGLYASRASLNPILFSGDQPGGQLITTSTVENYLGLDGTDGYELTEKFRVHAQQYGLKEIPETVTFLAREDETGCFVFHTNTGTVYRARSIIIATGATAKRLGLPHEVDFWNRGISACAVCDGALPMFRNQEIAVVGGGDTAMEEALYLSKFAKRVYLIHRSDRFRASNIMLQHVKENKKIEVWINQIVVDCYGDEEKGKKENNDEEARLSGIKIKHVVTGQETNLPVKGLFYAVGHIPNSQVFRTLVETDTNGYIVTIPGSTKTKIPGIFACGDVQDKIYRQAITAAGSGCMAALDVEKYLQSILK